MCNGAGCTRMADNVSLKIEEIDAISTNVRNIETVLQTTIRSLSVDIFSQPTRLWLDRCVIIAIIISFLFVTGQTIDNIPVNGVNLHIDKQWILYLTLFCVVVFFGVGALLLSISDYKRWEADYQLQTDTAQKLRKQLEDYQYRQVSAFADFGRAVDEAVGQGQVFPSDDKKIPLILKIRQLEVEEALKSAQKLTLQFANPLIKLRRSKKLRFIFFSIFPLLFAASSAVMSMYMTAHSLMK